MTRVIEWVNGITATGEKLDPVKVAKYRERRGMIGSIDDFRAVLYECNGPREAEVILTPHFDGETETRTGSTEFGDVTMAFRLVDQIKAPSIMFISVDGGTEIVATCRDTTPEERESYPCLLCVYNFEMADGTPVVCYMTVLY